MAAENQAPCINCAALQEKVDRLEAELAARDEAAEYAEENRLRLERRADDQVRRARREADEARREAEDRAYETNKLVRALDEARRYGDEYRVEELTRKLGRL